ncbi:uncharacterized protein LOC101845126 [Aplysia californica]|uniref:Uncharacterized protein LOC101845126 n=1 Tax=Aplysia californica TaxID=6500 RepID=A0ABM0K1Y7_APLCA|nr:uncharacterized protein LOC101845126 [Aplysia californica]
MADNVIRREVQRRDDPFGIPACFYWTVDEVADWIDSIGYGKYKENFRSHFINGRKLLTVDSCVLPKMGITHFGDILALARLIRDQLHISRKVKDFNHMYPHVRRSYIAAPHPSGTLRKAISYQRHAREVENIVQARFNFLKKRNYYYSGWSMEPWWDEKLKQEEEQRTYLAGQSANTKPSIGSSLQDRLREAALRESKSTDQPGPPSQQSLQSQRRRSSTDQVGVVSVRDGRILGQVSWTKVDVKKSDGRKLSGGSGGSMSELKEARGRKVKNKRSHNGPYLPIVFHWKQMEETKGYPQLENVDMPSVC